MKELDLDFDHLDLDPIHFEKTVINVFQRDSDFHHGVMIGLYGKENIVENGFERRTDYEVHAGLAAAKKRNKFIINTEIVNLPYTVMDRFGRPAKTAFTSIGVDKIFLVPDYTPNRVREDAAIHISGYEMLRDTYKGINKKEIDQAIEAVHSLTNAERVGATILHEQGHLLNYLAMDGCNTNSPSEVYEWFDQHKYIDNCAKRVVNFSQANALHKVNIAMEVLAEDYRVSFEMRGGYCYPNLPHAVTYLQDIKNPDNFMEGVEIMSKLLTIEDKQKRIIDRQKDALKAIVPFGEADRESAAKFSLGDPQPITEDMKKKDLELLRRFEKNFK